MKQNITIAVIIIVLFILLAIAGFMIWAMQNHVSFFSKKRAVDEESGGGEEEGWSSFSFLLFFYFFTPATINETMNKMRAFPYTFGLWWMSRWNFSCLLFRPFDDWYIRSTYTHVRPTIRLLITYLPLYSPFYALHLPIIDDTYSQSTNRST